MGIESSGEASSGGQETDGGVGRKDQRSEQPVLVGCCAGHECRRRIKRAELDWFVDVVAQREGALRWQRGWRELRSAGHYELSKYMGSRMSMTIMSWEPQTGQ